MKVLFCSPYLSDPDIIRGGINTWGKYILSYYNEVGDNNIDIIPISFDRKTCESGIYSSVGRILRGVLEYRKPIIAAIKKMREDDIQVVHLCTSGAMGLIRDLLLLFYARKKNIKTVIHFHFGRIPELIKSHNWESYLLKRILKMSDIPVVMNRESETILFDSGYKSTQYLPNPLGHVIAQSISVSLGKWERIPKRLLFVGHVLKTKGVYELVKACSQLDNIELRLVGRCSAVVKSELEVYAKESKNGNWLQFVGEVDHSVVIEEFMKADIFVFPSYTEGFPNVILEAMACRCPIVASAVGAIPEMLNIENDACGICVEPGNVIDIRRSIEKLLDNSKMKACYADKASVRVKEKYSMPVVWNKLVAIWCK